MLVLPLCQQTRADEFGANRFIIVIERDLFIIGIEHDANNTDSLNN